jgi:hypothetical protein
MIEFAVEPGDVMRTQRIIAPTMKVVDAGAVVRVRPHC